jgi:hypothetical protein
MFFSHIGSLILNDSANLKKIFTSFFARPCANHFMWNMSPGHQGCDYKMGLFYLNMELELESSQFQFIFQNQNWGFFIKVKDSPTLIQSNVGQFSLF